MSSTPRTNPTNASAPATRKDRARVLVLAARGLALGGIALGGLASCDDGLGEVDTASIAVRTGNTEGSSPNAEFRDVAGLSREVEGGSAALLSAEAELALGLQAAEQAAAAERRVLDDLAAIRDTWLLHRRHTSAALSAEAFDPSAEASELDAQRTRREREIRAAREQAELIGGELDALRASAQAEENETAEILRRVGEMELTSATRSAVEAAEMAKQIRLLKREADAHRMRAGLIDAEADQLEIQVREAELELARLEGQRARIIETRDELDAAARVSREAAADARASASTQATRADETIERVRATRSSEIIPPSDDAARRFSQAASLARKATKDSRTAAQATAGDAHRSLGTLHMQRAQGHAAFASTLRMMTGLPESGRYMELADAEDALSQEHAAQAAEAFESARSAFEGSGARGSAADRVEAVTRTLAALSSAAGGGPAEMPELDAMGTDPGLSAGADGASAPMSPEAREVFAVLTEMKDQVKAKRFAALADYVQTGDPAMDRAVRQVTGLAETFADVDAAFAEQYGAGLVASSIEQASEAMGNLPPDAAGGASGQMAALSMLQGQSWDDLIEQGFMQASALDIQVEGDTAVITPPADADGAMSVPMQMTRTNGVWQIDLTAFVESGMIETKYVELVEFATPLVDQALTQLAGEYRSGTYADAETARNAMELKLQPLLFQIAPKMQELGIEVPGGGLPGF